jgi:hypothetical protein
VQQLDATDVLVIYAPDGMKIIGEQRAQTSKIQLAAVASWWFTTASSGDEHDWARKVQGGSAMDGEKTA